MRYLIITSVLFIASAIGINEYRGDLYSGTYSPSPSSEANLDSSPTIGDAQYMRVGNTVTVSGSFTADPTVILSSTTFKCTIPISSVFATAGNCGGVISGSGVSEPGIVFGSNTDEITFIWISASTSDHSYYYTYTYQIIE